MHPIPPISTDSPTSPVHAGERAGATQASVRSFRDVSNGMVRIGTNVLATGLILIGGVVLGQQLLDYWDHTVVGVAGVGSPGASPAAEPARDLGTRLAIGAHPLTVWRGTVQGDRQAALRRLRDDARQMAESRQPGEGQQPWPAESVLSSRLGALAASDPAERLAGGGKLYERAEPLPMVMVVEDRGTEPGRGVGLLAWGIGLPATGGSTAAGSPAAASPAAGSPAAGSPAAGSPAAGSPAAGSPAAGATAAIAPADWTTMVIGPSRVLAGAPQVVNPLPESCRRLLAVADHQVTLIGFSSDLTDVQVAAGWDEVAARGGWRAAGAWRQPDGRSWHRRWRGPDGGVEVQFATDPEGTILGFCWSTTAAPGEVRSR